MKIEKSTKDMIKFEDVEVGECFMTEERLEDLKEREDNGDK